MTITIEEKDPSVQIAQGSSDLVLHPLVMHSEYAYDRPNSLCVELSDREDGGSLGDAHSGARPRWVVSSPSALIYRIWMQNDHTDTGQSSIAGPNTDVTYGLGFMDLSTDPVVYKVPDLGDRFRVYVIYDQCTNQIGRIGKPTAPLSMQI